jgi:hypothetical protein
MISKWESVANPKKTALTAGYVLLPKKPWQGDGTLYLKTWH